MKEVDIAKNIAGEISSIDRDMFVWAEGGMQG